jgi:uncharacterized repeat protein (TIGR03833 family)
MSGEEDRALPFHPDDQQPIGVYQLPGDKERAERATEVTMVPGIDPRNRAAIRPGMTVDIVTKGDQRSGRMVRGTVREILTGSGSHPHGIKVRLTDGRVGRVKAIVDPGMEKDG